MPTHRYCSIASKFKWHIEQNLTRKIQNPYAAKFLLAQLTYQLPEVADQLANIQNCEDRLNTFLTSTCAIEWFNSYHSFKIGTTDATDSLIELLHSNKLGDLADIFRLAQMVEH